MDVVKLFHMTGGNGLTSYTNNSDLQKKASDMVKHITLEAVKEVYTATRPKSFAMADLGCSSGPNTVSIIRDIIGSVHEASRELMSPAPELIQVFLNDLPSNDFNSVFKSLPDFTAEFGDTTVLVGGYPGSFYRRLFPNNCLHFVYSSHSVHWLSKVPPALYDKQGKSINKGAIYISEKSPKEVSKAYLEQFKDDFSMFLRKRCEEMVSGGKMVLIMNGRVSAECVCRGNTFLWDLLSRSLAVLVSEGLIGVEKIDSYDANFYAPSKEELEGEVTRDGSFELEQSEMFEVKMEEKNGNVMTMSYGTRLAKAVRAIQESLIGHHFGGAILDRLFEIYGSIIDEEMAKEEIRPVILVIVLKKL